MPNNHEDEELPGDDRDERRATESEEQIPAGELDAGELSDEKSLENGEEFEKEDWDEESKEWEYISHAWGQGYKG